MPSDRIDWSEHSFHMANNFTEVDTDRTPDDPHRVRLALGKTYPLAIRKSVYTRQRQTCDRFEAAGLDQTILDVMIG